MAIKQFCDKCGGEVHYCANNDDIKKGITIEVVINSNARAGKVYCMDCASKFLPAQTFNDALKMYPPATIRGLGEQFEELIREICREEIESNS